MTKFLKPLEVMLINFLSAKSKGGRRDGSAVGQALPSSTMGSEFAGERIAELATDLVQRNVVALPPLRCVLLRPSAQARQRVQTLEDLEDALRAVLGILCEAIHDQCLDLRRNYLS